MSLTPGSRLGPYEILTALGAGGMGEVYRAIDTRLDREVAIKVLPAATANDAAALARFEREAKAVAALSHPNILAIHDFGSADGRLYAVSELLQGETLRQRLDHGALPIRRAVEIGREIALGLAAAHEKGIVHRDLKPENLFLTRDGLVKILDFGLARQTRRADSDGGQTLTDHSESGSVVGTAGYMSPEQVRGEKVDHRSDIFSFGSVLYEMVSGKRAFRGDTSVETMNAILKEEPPDPSESGRLIPVSVERTVAHCLEKRPEDRFQSARDLAFDLGTLPAGTSASSGRAAPTRRRLRKLMVSAAVAAVAALLFSAGIRLGPGLQKTQEPTFRRLTSRRGNVLSARFTADGKTVVYSAAWDGKPTELFSVRTDSVESTPLGIEKAVVLSVSPQGELAILKKNVNLRSSVGMGTLAQLSLGSNAPKELHRDVFSADWTPDGRELAVVRAVGGKEQLEFPIGRVLKESVILDRSVRVSPDGALVATLEGGEAGNEIVAFDRNGRKRILASVPGGISGYDWSPNGREIFFVGGAASETVAVRAADISSGRQRVLMPAVGSNLVLHDVSSDGRILLERASRRRGSSCLRAGEPGERDVSWGDGFELRDVSDDGRTLLFTDSGDGRRNAEVAYLRQCDGSAPIRLGDGSASFLSPDAQSALVVRGSDLWMLPAGPGSPKKIPLGELKASVAQLVPGGKRIAIWRPGEKGEALLSVAGLDGGPPQAVRMPDFRGEGFAYSPDGELMAYDATDGSLMAASLSGGDARPLPGPPAERDSQIVTWSADGRFLFLARVRPGIPGTFLRREISTGKTTSWLVFQPPDLTGVTTLGPAIITPDGRSYAYSYERVEASDLFVVDGLH